MKLLSIGEIMVELTPASGGLFAQSYAGDTFNTAWYARKVLGAGDDVTFATVLGDDPISDGAHTFIQTQGIAPLVHRHPTRTMGLYMIQTQGGERSFSYWRGQSAAKTLADDPDRLDQMLAGQDLIHFSGITLAILPRAARHRFQAAMAKARANGAHISFDTNIRPTLWEDAQALTEGLMLGASCADTVLPSFDEEQAVFGDATAQDTVARYQQAGAQCVAVKDGSGPCLLWSQKEGFAHSTPPKVAQIVDSTAAGDSFAAGFLCARLQGADLAQAADQGSALAAQVIQHKGALAQDMFREDKT